MIHPWTSGPISQAPWWDLGAVLYTHAHSVHHKSTNPGPRSGMSMHPVEHFFYFQCAWLPLLAAAVPALAMHPMHFLYAIFHACVLRFRPILMTTMAALLGALPLALGHGDGAELRTPLGISIVGGLLVSQILTLYTTPVVYLALDKLRLWLLGRRKEAPLPALDTQGS